MRFWNREEKKALMQKDFIKISIRAFFRNKSRKSLTSKIFDFMRAADGNRTLSSSKNPVNTGGLRIAPRTRPFTRPQQEIPYTM